MPSLYYTLSWISNYFIAELIINRLFHLINTHTYLHIDVLFSYTSIIHIFAKSKKPQKECTSLCGCSLHNIYRLFYCHPPSFAYSHGANTVANNPKYPRLGTIRQGYTPSSIQQHRKSLKPLWLKAFPMFPNGGDKRDRTADLLNAIQALSHVNGKAPPFSHFQV